MVKQTGFSLFFSAIILSIILLTSCKADKKLHYVVKTPTDWSRKDGFTPEHWKKSTFEPQEGDTIFYSGENIIITCFQFKNIDEYIRILQQEVKKTTIFYQEKGREKLKINGLDARWVLSEIRIRAYPKLTFEQKNYFIKDKGTLFMIICTARKDNIDVLQPIIDELLASFKTEEDK